MTKFFSILLLCAALVSCTTSNHTTNQALPKQETITKPGPFAHTVYFWLKNPESKEDRAAFEKSLTNFIQSSKNITTKHIGIPADTDRDVIDRSYTYSLLLTFKDAQAQERYQNEAAHKQFIKESEILWSKVIVYDSLNILDE